MMAQQPLPIDSGAWQAVHPPENSHLRPRLSIILCTYNRRTMVLSALACLRRQTLSYALFEVIVVDNASCDSTLQTVRAYVNAGATQDKRPEDIWQVQCLMEPRNGLAYARNRGLQAARGDIAVFLDDDTLAEPSFLACLLSAYEATEADAIGGRVELHWDAPRPHWLSDDLLAMLGHFAPSMTRMPLPPTLSFSGCNFSVKMEALRAIGPPSPFLSKRLHVPTRIENVDLCQRLRKNGYTLWYEPAAVVAHRVPLARLSRAFFQGRAYWRGRSSAMLSYMNDNKNDIHVVTFTLLRSLIYELYKILQIALIHRPLLSLARRSTNEQLQAALAQTEMWGHLWQQIQFIEHAPALLSTPAVLFVHSYTQDTILPAQDILLAPQVRYSVSNSSIPLIWLWRHRTYRAQPIGIIHIHQPGAFDLHSWQRQRFCFLLRLAQCLGIRIVTTDTGGWWHNVRSLRFLARRTFERRLFSYSNSVVTYTRQIAQLYPDKRLRRRVHFLVHPGYRNYYPPPIAHEQAWKQLGIPPKTSFVYLCLAYLHTEHELLHLIAAFIEAAEQQQRKKESTARKKLQLLLLGSPKDRKASQRLLKHAATNSAIHIFMERAEKELPLFMSAAHTVVFPHFALSSAGILDMALLALSVERTIVAPDLPRFHGVLPSHGSILYDANSRAALVQALVKIQSPRYHLRERDLRALDAKRGWLQHGQRLREIYHILLDQQ